jgi:hypothetical protein
MAACRGKCWWEHEESILKIMPDGFEIPAPATMTKWEDNMMYHI